MLRCKPGLAVIVNVCSSGLEQNIGKLVEIRCLGDTYEGAQMWVIVSESILLSGASRPYGYANINQPGTELQCHDSCMRMIDAPLIDEEVEHDVPALL